mmetsp:Transcript_20233/g.20342  ORF Transcript_20233/g.20342 Transcript_20233/m.20342 type:complete len:442 (+) Transcript_20233:148-1473(+)
MEKQEEKKSWGTGGLFGHRTISSLALILACPYFVMILWYGNCHCNGSLIQLVDAVKVNGALFAISKVSLTNVLAWKIILSFMVFELALMRLVPGKEFRATTTATGHVPIYNANGVECYFISIATLFGLSYFKLFSPSLVYDNMGDMLISMCVFALVICICLMFKGLYFPSTADSGSTGDTISDFFWGTELYPRVLGFDIKQFTNCRFGMMYWQLGILCYAFKQYEVHGCISSAMLVSVVVQTVYIFKFFLWETGYLCSMDIQHDRAGYYICWGCLVWVPSVYTLHTFYLVDHPIYLSAGVAVLYIIAGVACVWCNYDCDRQRQEFRKSNGTMRIWGGPAYFITASYTTADGVKRSSLLLTCGWWGVSRHFHYIPEILASVFWCIPNSMAIGGIIPFFYPIYLTLLLLDRAWRDDARCAEKYGEDWKRYCKEVPYKIIPGVI